MMELEALDRKRLQALDHIMIKKKGGSGLQQAGQEKEFLRRGARLEGGGAHRC